MHVLSTLHLVGQFPIGVLKIILGRYSPIDRMAQNGQQESPVVCRVEPVQHGGEQTGEDHIGQGQIGTGKTQPLGPINPLVR